MFHLPRFPARLHPAASLAALATALLTLIPPLTACRDAGPPPPADGTDLAPDFTLSDQHGQPFSLRAQRGHLVLLFFGYTYCPDVCPTVLAGWTRIAEELGETADDVEFVFVTVDPERDSAERLAKHLAVFGPRFKGLRGSAEDLAPVFDAYRVVPRKVPIGEGARGYLMDHPNAMILIDRTGRIAAKFDYRKYPAEIAAELRRYIDDAPISIRVRDAWSWPTAAGPSDPTTGGEKGPGVAYLSIRNEGPHDDRLVAARSEICAEVELHETRRVGDNLRMVPVENGLPIPAGASVELRPGGAHLMLMGLHRDLLPGERFAVVLVFERAGEVQLESEVRSP